MLVTSRRVGESIRIDDDIEVVILDITPTRVRLGISAPQRVRVARSELVAQIEIENAAAVRPPAGVEAAWAGAAGKKKGDPRIQVSSPLADEANKTGSCG